MILYVIVNYTTNVVLSASSDYYTAVRTAFESGEDCTDAVVVSVQYTPPMGDHPSPDATRPKAEV